MVAAVREPSILKRFYSDTFAPPSGFHSGVRGPEVTAEEILAGGVRESDWSFPVLISTPSVDRQGDSVIPEGCDYGAFGRSAIAFFDHQEIRFPVGKLRGPDGRLYFCIIPGKGILGRIWIRKPEPDDPPAYAEACKTVWILVRDGLLNGISAGFDPIGPIKSLHGGGSLYKEWELLEISIVPIAANRECRVIREPFSGDDVILKRFSPSVIKGLKTMSATAVAKGEGHKNTKDIKYRNGKWELLDDTTRKVLSTHATREEALGALRAIEFHKHGGKSATPEEEKDMSESSGTQGGYTVPDEEKATRAEICKRMDENECKGHYAYFHPTSGEMRHVHPADMAPEKVKSIAGDLHDIPGVKALTQTSEHPKTEEGFHKVYEGAEQNRDKPCRKSVTNRMASEGKALFGLTKQRQLKSWGIEQAVRRVVPFLTNAGISETRAVHVSWGIVGRKKGFGPLIEKAMADDKPDEEEDTRDDAELAADDAATDAAMDVPEGEGTEGPDGLELVQAAIENLEAAIPRLEPERREFWQGIIEQIRDHGEEIYPGEDFGGEDDAGAEAAAEGGLDDAKEQKETDEMLARYKSYRPVRVKRISVVKVVKSLQKDPDVVDTLHKVGNHLHGIAGLHPEFHAKTGDCVGMKGYTAAMHKACGRMGRDVDRVIGAIGGIKKSDKTASPEPKPSEETPSAESGEDHGPIIKSMREEFAAMKTQLVTAAGLRRG